MSRRILALLVALLLPAIAVGAPQALDPDDPPIIQAVKIAGLEGRPEAAVVSALGQRVGEPFDPAAVSQGVQYLWNTYRIIVKKTWLTPVAGGAEFHASVLEQPVDYEPRFVGNSEIDTSTLLDWANLTDRAELFLHDAQRVKMRLLEGYRRKGFHFIEVDVVAHGEDLQDEGTPDVIFDIREGPKVRCTSVETRGNVSLPDTGWGFFSGGLSSLAKRQIKGKGIFRWWGGVFSEDVLQADLVAMRQTYRDRGWLDVKVEVEELAFNEGRNRVVVHLLVDEGPQYHVASVRVAAVETLREGSETREVESELLYSEDELIELLELKPGVPYERARLVHDRRVLRDFYGERGYIESRHFENPRDSEGWEFLNPDVVVDVEKHEVLVTYRVRQGRQRFVREVRLAGNDHTRDRVLRREINVLPGQVANIKQIERARGRLAGTGYFSNDRDPEHREPIFIFHETGDPDEVDVEYRVQEGRVVDFNLSGGVGSDSGLVGLISLSMRNFDANSLPSSPWATFGEIYRKEAFHGDGEILMLDLSPGSQVSYWRVRYRHPDIFGSNFNRWAMDNQLQSRQRRFRSHDEDRDSIQVEFERFFGHNTSFSIGPIRQKIDISDVDEDDAPDSLIDSEGTSRFLGLALNLRYNQIDNRINPRDGFFLRWRNTMFGGPLGQDEDIIKTEVTFDGYHPLGDPEEDARPGVYVGAGVGVAHPFDDTDQVNYAERYFLGGSSTLRGFQFRGVGPNQRDYAIGGETYLRGTIEYRYPLYTVPIPGTSRRREMFRGFVFTDAGILDPNSFEVAIDQTRASWGFGFGLTSPLPLTFNFGFPLREDDGDETEVFSFRLSFR